MKFSLFLFSLCVLYLLSLPAASASTETFTFGRFGVVTVYYDRPQPAQVMLLVSGAQGWNQEAMNVASALASLDALVVGIDLPQYLRTLSVAEETCSYPGGDFAALNKFVQQRYGFSMYRHPVLVGYGDGAALAYATMAQAPPDMFLGVLSLGFCPELTSQKSLCEWNSLKWQSPPRDNRFRLAPGTALAAPWIALRGEQDQVCSAATVETFAAQVNRGTFVSVPRVGHDFSVPNLWLPQFTQAFARLIETTTLTPQVNALADLPLLEVPATGPSTETLAVLLSGDGGWATIDREFGTTLARHGVPVVGFNSLKYFWTRRTPDEAAKDLERILRHYLVAWKKSKIVLLGYSLGADVLPFMANRLPEDLLKQTSKVVLLGPAHLVDFEFHLADWLPGSASTATHPILPEVQKLSGAKILCVYGEEEADTLCPDLDPQRATVLRLKGGHHFKGDYDALAETVLREGGSQH